MEARESDMTMDFRELNFNLTSFCISLKAINTWKEDKIMKN